MKTEDVGVGDGEEAAAAVYTNMTKPETKMAPVRSMPKRYASTVPQPTRLPGEQCGERRDRDEPAKHLDRGAVLARPEVGQREQVRAVHVPPEEEAIEDERKPEPDREHGAVVVVVLVGEVGVAEHGVRVDALRSECESADGQRERAAGDEVVVRLAADEVGRAHAGEAEHDDGDDDKGAEAASGIRGLRGLGQAAHPILAALPRLLRTYRHGRRHVRRADNAAAAHSESARAHH